MMKKITFLIIVLLASGLSMAQPGNALNFDGANDVVVVPNNSTLEFITGTIEVWLKPGWVAGTAGYNPGFIGMRDASSSRYSFHIRNDYSALDLFNIGVHTITYTFAQGEWYHIALVFKFSTTDVYINGIYQGTMDQSVNPGGTGKNLNIGSSIGIGEFFKGEIDEVRIWSSQRTACEIASYRNTELTGNETGLLAYYNFNQGFAGENNIYETTLPDLTSNQFNGTLNNFTLQTTTSNWIASGADVTTSNTPVDNISPVLYVPADISVDCGTSLDPVNTGGNATATDICDANPVVSFTDVKSGAIVTRTWNATDASGNETIGEQIITINDNAPPVTPELPTLEGETSVTAVAPTTTDDCAGTITRTTSDPTVYTQQGIHTITWTFDDGNGNTTTADQKVIVDNGQNMKLEFYTFSSPGTTITLPLNGTVDVTVNWGDGNIESTTSSANLDHTYSSHGTYTVFISGSLSHFGRGNYSNANKLTKVLSFGSLGITDFSYAFNNASKLTEVPSTLPDGVTNTSGMFFHAEIFNQDLNNWDVSNVTDMSYMFEHAHNFNGNISGWNVDKVTTIVSMFRFALYFNQNLNNWNVSNVVNMFSTFEGAYSFNGNITGWNVNKVENMSRMFYYAYEFNQDIGNWLVGNVTNMSWMFYQAFDFNQGLNNWNVGNVTDMSNMFNMAIQFNQDIGNWNVSKVQLMNSMLEETTAFDQDISGWDVSMVTNMSFMFLNAGLSTTNYDAFLNALSALALQENVSFHAGNSKYSCFSESARTDLINDLNWAITDGGKVNDAITINTQPAASTDICESAPETVLTVVASSLFPVSYQWYKDDIIIASEGNNSSFTIPTSFANSGTYYCVVSNTCGVNQQTNNAVVTINDDVTPPETPTLPTLAEEYSVTAVAPTTTDACAGTITGITSDPTEYTAQGIYTITWTFNDGNGNSTTADQKVIVNNGQNMILEFNTNLSAGTTITLPLNGTVDVSVDWGDGSSESTTNSANLSHTYSNEGTYLVTISGSLTQFGRSSYPNADKLTRAISFGSLGITDLSYAFYYAINLTEVPSALPAGVTNTSYMFHHAETFNQNLTNWDVSSVTDMNNMFSFAYAFNGDVSGWNVGQVTTMERMFRYASVFNQDLNNWDVSNVVDMSELFVYAFMFNGNISNWDVSKVKTMYYMFAYTDEFNQDLNNWNTSSVNNMSWMFYDAIKFNQDLNNWNISAVTALEGMFSDAVEFNGDIGSWDVSKVTSFEEMFYGALKFNRDISGWDVDSIVNMTYMFANTDSFNQDISSWDVSNVINMSDMFNEAVAFNQNISNWNVSKVIHTSYMFNGAVSFDQDISSWDVSNVKYMSDMFTFAGLSTINYDKLLNAWSNLTLQNNVNFGGGNSTYSCLSEAARTKIINDFNWTINDGGKTSNVIINTQPADTTEVCENTTDIELSVEATGAGTLSYQWYKDAAEITTNGTDSILAITTNPANSGTYTCVITGACDEDTTTDAVVTINDDITPPDTPNLQTAFGEDSVTVTAPTTIDGCAGTITGTTFDSTHYEVQGTYTITWIFDDGNGNSTTADQEVIVHNGQNMLLEFNTNLSAGTTITLPLNGTVDVTVDWGDGNSESTTNSANLSYTYSSEGTYLVTISGSLTHFGRSSYPNADKLTRAISFGSLGITDLSYAFYAAKNLIEVPSILPTGVTNTSYMFYQAFTFNQDLNSWDVSNVTNMSWMFGFANAFNGNISGWDVSNVTDMSWMFGWAYAFNGNISGWNVGQVTTMENMFFDASVFNQDLNNWDVSNVVNMRGMFVYALVFNGNISNWNVSKVQNMANMFSYTNEFNQDIGNWNTSSVTDMSSMFGDAALFNRNISNWDVSNVTDMSYMFSYTDSFNQDISNWDVSAATTMEGMFEDAALFNGNISNWDVRNVTNMSDMFWEAALSTVNYDALLNAWSTLTLQNNVTFHGGNSTYSCLSEAARTKMINDFNWNINDAGLFSDDVGISVQPESSTNVWENTEDIVLSVEANGEIALSYQWYKDDEAITSDGDSSSLIITTLPANSGTYVCVVTSACGASEQSANAIVEIMDDITAPETPALADLTGECSVTVVAPTTTDAAAGTITGTTSDPLEYTEQGNYTIIWTFDDGNGNSIDVNQNVIVNDVTNPTITCIDNQTVNADATSNYTVQGTEFDLIVADDNCGVGSVENDFNNSSTLGGSQFPVGTTTVTWIITDNAGNTNSCSFDIVVNKSTGIKTIQNKGISVYPNPVSETINFNFVDNNVVRITILDITGKVVFEKPVIQKNESLNVSGWKNGVYIIRFQTDKDVMSTKIIKE